ncbi:TerD family protein [Streptomyces amritsarensis]|uniref:TerD family protein n=1 Tax=Streptomyces amritsarensis TaxID=681158 RepID=UPI003694D786
MSVSLSKGGHVSLSKEAPGVTAVRVALGWDVRTTTGADYDLDASALLCGKSGRAPSHAHFVFDNDPTSPDGSVEHAGDNRTGGDGPGDDEAIAVDFTRMAAEVDQTVFTVNSFTGATFDEVENPYCRLVDESTEAGLARYTLSGGGHHTAQIMAKFSRIKGSWQLTAIGEPAWGPPSKTSCPPSTTTSDPSVPARRSTGWSRPVGGGDTTA